MARSYSQDLRDRVIEATESGTSARKVAARFEVAASTAIKWLERLRDSGERSARRHHQHGAPVWPRAARRAPARSDPARQSQQDHARGRAAAERGECDAVARRATRAT